MKQVSLVMTLGVVCIILFSSNVRSEEVERVYEEELVLTDPTVSAKGRWKIGGAVEAWYVDHPLYNFDQNGALKKTADVDGFQPGISGFLAYGSWTLMASYRQGDFDLTDAPGGGTLVGGVEVLDKHVTHLRGLSVCFAERASSRFPKRQPNFAL